ncbi:hypothetical protein RUM43_012490 [Polyplax serrata]|uniref:Uncharacterized protein n=1 Tax=Polyplax serrata TaxID=468196 RepID=A0AAN8NKT0_POLSC
MVDDFHVSVLPENPDKTMRFDHYQSRKCDGIDSAKGQCNGEEEDCPGKLSGRVRQAVPGLSHLVSFRNHKLKLSDFAGLSPDSIS